MAALSAADLAVDRELADIGAGFRFLLDLTPIDPLAVRLKFEHDGRPPRFQYRPLGEEVRVAGERLAKVDPAAVTDRAVEGLLMAKKRELRLQLEMLAARESADFLWLSTQLYGSVSSSLLSEARAILTSVPVPEPEAGPWLDASEFVDAANDELDHYRRVAPDVEAHVEIRDGSTGVMVSNGDLLVAPAARVPVSRVNGLLQHEVGTHMVTYMNGAHQPLRIMAGGLADHEKTQEALAVLAEYLVGDLSPGRLRQLAARVIAVRHMTDGAAFPDVHHELVASGVDRVEAFTIALRVFRSGGLTKDAIYLSGLRELVEYLAAGGDLSPLWLGKLALHDVPNVRRLRRRGVLREPLVRPRYLDDLSAQGRLAHVRQVGALPELVGPA